MRQARPFAAGRFARRAATPVPVVHTSEVPRSHPSTSPAEYRLADVLDLLAGVVALGLVVVTLEGRPSVPRVLLTLIFTSYVPGRAIVANWPAMAGWSEVILALVFSLAILCLIAMTALWAHYWHPVAIFQAEAVLSIAGIAFAMGHRHRRSAGRRSRSRHGRGLRAPRPQP